MAGYSTSAKMGEFLLCCQADQAFKSQQCCQLCLRATENTVISETRQLRCISLDLFQNENGCVS